MTQMVPLQVGEAVEVQLNVQPEPRPAGLLQVTEPGTTVGKRAVAEPLKLTGTLPAAEVGRLQQDRPQITQQKSLETEAQENPFRGFPWRQQRHFPSVKSAVAMCISPVVAVADFMTRAPPAALVLEVLAVEVMEQARAPRPQTSELSVPMELQRPVVVVEVLEHLQLAVTIPLEETAARESCL
jgi:hypothetical protein